MYQYLILAPIIIIFGAAALALPWFIVRAGYREVVQTACACVSVLALCATTGVFSYINDTPMAILYGSGAFACFLFTLDCALPLYLTRKKADKS